MNTATLVVRNLGRNKLRAGLTVFAVALPMALFLLTTAMCDVLDDLVGKAADQLRLAVHHRSSLFESLPVRVRPIIESLDPDRREIVAVCGMAFFGGHVENAPNFPMGGMAIDNDSMEAVFPEYKFTPNQISEFNRYKNAIIISKMVADHWGWTIEREIELKGDVPPFLKLRFRVVGIHAGPDAHAMFFRNDYLDDELRRRKETFGRVHFFWIKCRRADQMQDLGRRIDDAMRDSADPTLTEDESTFIAGFIKATGDIPRKLQLIGLAAVFAVITVAGNTMSLSFRERTSEMAVFKALGFSRGWLVRVVLAESLTLAIIGAAVGVVPLYVLFHAVEVTDIGFGPMARFVIPLRSALTAMGAGVGVGILSGLLPALTTARLHVVDALRRTG